MFVSPLFKGPYDAIFCRVTYGWLYAVYLMNFYLSYSLKNKPLKPFDKYNSHINKIAMFHSNAFTIIGEDILIIFFFINFYFIL